MRITLATQYANRDYIPLALLYLKAALVGRGCAGGDITILEFDPERAPEEIAAALLASEPDVLGLSCYVWNITTTLAAARLVKADAPTMKIVLGGPEVGPVAADVLRSEPCVDAIVKSEGEIPFADIIEAWHAKRCLDGVPGIAFRQRDAIVDTGAAALVKDLAGYPSPHLTRFVDYTRRRICIETQRGCVFQCNFCFYNKDYSLRNRRFDLDRLKEELLALLELDVLEIYLMDPVFNLNAARAKEICRFIAAHNRRRIPIHSEIWAEFVDDEMAALMRQAGFEFLEVGLQTTDPTALATADRRLRLERFREGIAHLQRHKLHFELHLIYGLPGETPSTFRESLNFALALDPPVLTVFPLLVLPGTELWRKARSLNLEFDPAPPYSVRSHLSMSADDIEYGSRLIRAVGFLQRSRTIRFLSRERRLTFAEIVDEWLAWRPDDRLSEADRDTMIAFVADLCDRKGVPAAFYRGFAAREFDEAESRTLSATRTTSAIAATP